MYLRDSSRGSLCEILFLDEKNPEGADQLHTKQGRYLVIAESLGHPILRGARVNKVN